MLLMSLTLSPCPISKLYKNVLQSERKYILREYIAYKFIIHVSVFDSFSLNL